MKKYTEKQKTTVRYEELTQTEARIALQAGKHVQYCNYQNVVWHTIVNAPLFNGCYRTVIDEEELKPLVEEVEEWKPEFNEPVIATNCEGTWDAFFVCMDGDRYICKELESNEPDGYCYGPFNEIAPVEKGKREPRIIWKNDYMKSRGIGGTDYSTKAAAAAEVTTFGKTVRQIKFIEAIEDEDI